MKLLPLFLLASLLLTGCDSATAQDGDTRFAELPKSQTGEAVATFASGCYWTTQHIFDAVKGVRVTVAGHTGGTAVAPTYEQVARGTTGHAEAVQVYYDPQVVSYATLLKIFFIEHDPTTRNRQGPDVGDEYRSAVFYRTPAEKEAVITAIRQTNESKRYRGAVVTEVAPFKVFYPAERYHQEYAVRHPAQPYIANVSQARFVKFVAECPNLVKAGAR